MLKIERITSDGRLKLGFRQKTLFLDSTLIKALFFSACIHVLLISSFRIKMFDFQESAPMHPISVALDPEGEDALQAIVDVGDESHPLFFTHTLESGSWNSYCQNQAEEHKDLEKTFDVAHDTTSLLSLIDDQYIASQADEIPYPIRVYPLKVKLSSNLKSLKLIEDGSAIFQEKLNKLPPSSNHYMIEYQVEVNRGSGTIVSHSRKKELLDKPLQDVADRLIQKLRFAKGPDKISKGTITLDFFYSGEQIQDFLDD